LIVDNFFRLAQIAPALAMAPRRRSESRAVKLATSAAIFVLSANVAYQVSQSLGRPAPAPR